MPHLLHADHAALMRQLRTLFGQTLADTQTLALFSMDDANCQLLVSQGGPRHAVPVLHLLPLGLLPLTQRSFGNALPTAIQLEVGIMEVEDAVMPVARLLPPDSLLVTQDPLLLALARQAAGQPTLGSHAPTAGQAPDHVTRQAVEALFEQLASQASRHYAGHHPHLPTEARAAAALLVLREALHHWQQERLYLLPASA
ncbi:hypothetical protein [Comamonas sp. GB3 AK4-5]|uniref:hypothetical protein n=1 Tax=Comamonas sp. GB3 AK4-5 TaxID=3231487 RepID=UPI00351F33EE